MPAFNITPEHFERIARNLTVSKNAYKNVLSEKQTEREWRSLFGTTSVVAAEIWNRIDIPAPYNARAEPKHLLYALVLLHKYPTDKAAAKIVNCHCNTFRKWAWIFIEAIFNLHQNVVSKSIVQDFYLAQREN